MKKVAVFISVLCIAIACTDKSENSIQQPIKPPKLGEYFFNFDEVAYYYINDSLSSDVIRNSRRSVKDSIGSMLLLGGAARNLNDTIAFSYLDSVGFKKMVIPISKHPALKEIFRERIYEGKGSTEETTCAPVYRDICVVRKDGIITGIVKVCFECGHHQIVGTDANTENFGKYFELRNLAMNNK